jgi:hypothetical protein
MFGWECLVVRAGLSLLHGGSRDSDRLVCGTLSSVGADLWRAVSDLEKVQTP